MGYDMSIAFFAKKKFMAVIWSKSASIKKNAIKPCYFSIFAFHLFQIQLANELNFCKLQKPYKIIRIWKDLGKARLKKTQNTDIRKICFVSYFVLHTNTYQLLKQADFFQIKRNQSVSHSLSLSPLYTYEPGLFVMALCDNLIYAAIII